MTEFSEDVLERELRYRLHEEMSGMTASPDLAATVRRRHRRRTWALRSAAVIPAVVAVAFAVALVAKPGTDPSGGPELLDVNSVSQQTSAALENAGDYVRHQHYVYSDGYTYDEWVDVTAEAHRIEEYAGGSVRSATVYRGEGPENALTVNYADRTYTRFAMAELRLAEGQPNDNAYRGDFLKPDEIRGLAADGRLQLVGSESVNGTDTVHLRWLQVEGFTLDLYVDAGSYLPVRMVAAGAKGSSTSDFTWLPRSPENLARFTLDVPAGFTEVAPEDPRHPSN
jgi:stage V sporulation protein SpoVS